MADNTLTDKQHRCQDCVFFSMIPKPGLDAPCYELGQLGDNPLVCGNWTPSNPPEQTNYAAEFLGLLLENSEMNRHAVETVERIKNLDFHCPELQADFKDTEFLKTCSQISGLHAVQSLCRIMGLPEEITLHILHNQVDRIFPGKQS